MSFIAVGIVLRSTVTADVVVVVHLLSVFLGVLMSPDLIELIHSLGLSESVDLGADKARNGLLGEFVANSLAYQSS